MPRFKLMAPVLAGLILSICSNNVEAAGKVVSHPSMRVAHSNQNGPYAASVQQGPLTAVNGYPYLNAPLYPSPSPYPSRQVGTTVITNPAFAPHEMMYAHRYKSMYGPYSYRVKGGWIWTPCGIKSEEHWKLQGTVVDVRYHSEISPFALFKPKRHRRHP